MLNNTYWTDPLNRNALKKACPKTQQTDVSSQVFFTNAANGLHKPIKPFEYDGLYPSINRFYEQYGSEFDEHIACSIPGFREQQCIKLHDLSHDLSIQSIIDLGGSNGTFCKYLDSCHMIAHNLEPNKAMEIIHSGFDINTIQECFYSGFDGIRVFKPWMKYDCVHESMLFQFMSGDMQDRTNYIDHIIEHYLNDNGVFITEQKFKRPHYEVNEIVKNGYKSQYFKADQLKQKQKGVLTGMESNQVHITHYMELLQSRFKSVDMKWSEGNFAGFRCRL